MDDRSERLRKRRKQSTERGSNKSASDSAEQDQHKNTGEQGTDGETETDQHPTPIKEQQTGTYMYLPDTQVRELRRLYNVLKAEYEFEYDEEFEKNRHFYPLVIQYGLDGLDEADIAEIRSHLDEFYE
jgi:hypothetical protein